jgi:hypothetical protein
MTTQGMSGKVPRIVVNTNKAVGTAASYEATETIYGKSLRQREEMCVNYPFYKPKTTQLFQKYSAQMCMEKCART